jgi:hypothetical protein
VKEELNAVDAILRMVKLDESDCDVACLTVKLDERSPTFEV